MSKAVDDFFDAITQVTQRQIEATAKDLTIDAEIKLLKNVETGEYKVEYQGNTFSAYSQNPEIVYQRGERVYVLVPQGDMSTKKIILGRASYDLNMTYQERLDMTNFYIEHGPNLLEIYTPDHEQMNICATQDNEKTQLIHPPANWRDYGFLRERPAVRDNETRYPVDYMEQQLLDEADEESTIYGDMYEYLKIEAEFRTDFNMPHSIGEYALVVEYLTKNEQYLEPDDPNYDPDIPKYVIQQVQLGFKNFNGDPYNFPVNTPQTAYYPVGVGMFKGLHSVSLWQNGELLTDLIQEYDDNGLPVFNTEKPQNFENNILVDNIKIHFAEKVDLTKSLFYPWIETPYGNQVYDASPKRPTGKGSVKLIAHLQYGIEDVMNKENCQVRWFVQNWNVTRGSEYAPTEEDKDEFNKTWLDYTGPGWMPIDKLIEDGNPYYEINFNELTVKKDAVPWKWEYRAVIIYQKSSQHDAYKEVVRFDSKYNLDIKQFNNKENTETYLEAYDTKRFLLGQIHDYWNTIDMNLYNSDEDFKQLADDQYGELLTKLKSYHDYEPGEEDTAVPYRKLFGTWYLMLPDDSYRQCSDKWLRGEFAISKWLRSDILTFRVAVYDPYILDPNNTGTAVAGVDGQDMIGCLEYTIVRDDKAEVIGEWIGQTLFNYDAQGSAHPWIRLTENILKAELKWAAGTPSAHRIDIFGPNGTNLKDKKWHSPLDDGNKDSGGGGEEPGYCPKNSMLQNIWAGEDNIVHFRVREKFDEELTRPENNTFIMRVVTTKTKKVYELPCTITFIKDGDQGTQGSDWIAPIYPCNGKEIDQNGSKLAQYTQKENREIPLVVVPAPGTPATGDYNEIKWVQDENALRIFIRPFVQKKNEFVEKMGVIYSEEDQEKSKAYKYYYKVYWDVRAPQSMLNPNAKLRSLIRLYHSNGNIFLAGDQGSEYENGGILKPAYNEADTLPDDTPDLDRCNGLTGFTMYPSTHLAPTEDEDYGTVEIRFYNAPDNYCSMKDLLYRFVVKAEIQVRRTAYNIETKEYDFGDGSDERLATIHSWYPIDVFFNADPGTFTFVNSNLWTNWPRYVMYDASGYVPNVNNLELTMYYGATANQQHFGEENNLTPINLTPLTQVITHGFTAGDLTADPVIPPHTYHKYNPNPYMDQNAGYWGAIITERGMDPNNNMNMAGWYLRCQTMTTNPYGNVDINGWDGTGIDINEERGTIFAPTIGAGYKHPITNLFSGVLMGVDRNYPRDAYSKIINLDEKGENGDAGANFRGGVRNHTPSDEWKNRPFLTGLFGYQEGEASFGIFENGTAFFGRRNRSRIILDGTNGTIYGGANGFQPSPTIGDPMWNTMRLSLVDLTHATGPDRSVRGNKDGYQPEKVINTDYDADENTWEKSPENTTTTDDKGDAMPPDDPKINPQYIPVDGIKQGYNGSYFGITGVDNPKALEGRNKQMPRWYGRVWSRAYIKPEGYLPWFMQDKRRQGSGVDNKGYFRTYLEWYEATKDVESAIIERASKNPDEDVKKINLSGDENSLLKYGWRINYWGKSRKEIKNLFRGLNVFRTTWENEQAYAEAYNKAIPDGNWTCNDKNYLESADGGVEGGQLTGFGPSRASTTPAIEIGQHRPGLMPGIIEWEEIEDVFRNLYIPGDRNFMVTYDGTLWAMNGVFLGNVIGSNILGGRIQGAEIGVGFDTEGNKGGMWLLEKPDGSDCDWAKLYSPSEVYWEATNENNGNYYDEDDRYWRPPTPFYVSTEGEVWAEKLHIRGGTIDLGHFHIVGPDENSEGGDASKDWTYGKIIQFGESDFIGHTHFYGNIGIGPNLNDDPQKGVDIKRYDPAGKGGGHPRGGNLYVTRGQVGLGIMLPEAGRILGFHTPSTVKDGEMGLNEEQQGTRRRGAPVSYYADGKEGQGIKIPGGRATLQEIAFFGIDSTSYNPPYNKDVDNPDKMEGHFWPMTFKWTKNVKGLPGSEVGEEERLGAYMTTMDIFKNIGIPVKTQNGQKAEWTTGSNYFRVGPIGPEFNQVFIRRDFQKEEECAVPAGDILGQSSKEKLPYPGFFGLVPRSSGSSAMEAIGIKSWYTAPILIYCDSEFGVQTRGRVQMYTRAHGSNARPNGLKETLYGEYAWGSSIQIGELITTPDKNGYDNNAFIRTARGAVGMVVEDQGKDILEFGHNGGTWGRPVIYKDNDLLGIKLDYEGQWGGAKEDGVVIWDKTGKNSSKIHIVKTNKKSNDHNTGDPDKQNSEICMGIQNINLNAADGVWMTVQHDAHKPCDSGATTDRGSVGVDLGSAGIYHPKVIALHTGISESCWSKTLLDFTEGWGIVIKPDQIWLGHNDGGFKGWHNHFQFYGCWAIPDNQFCIYARFG